MRKVVIAAAVSTIVPKEILLLLAQVVLADGAGRPKLAQGFRKKAWVLIKADPGLKGTTNLGQLSLPWNNKIAPWDKGFSKVVKDAQAFVDKHGKGAVKDIAQKSEPLGLVDSLVMQYISKPETLKLTDKVGKGPVRVANKAGSKILSVAYTAADDSRHQFMGTFTASGKWGKLMGLGVAKPFITGKSCTDEQALKAVTAVFELAKKKGLRSV